MMLRVREDMEKALNIHIDTWIPANISHLLKNLKALPAKHLRATSQS